MVAKSVTRALALLMVFPPAALALGLGEIRLLSSLNAPLDAEIELIGATPEELETLEAQIAPRETFDRYGLEWPAYLGSVTLRQERSRDGRDVIRVRSADVMIEPFVTMLVQVDWARGRLVREYTVLLDPPVFTPAPARVAGDPVAAPVTGATAREGAIDRAEEGAASPAPSAATVAESAPADDAEPAPSVAERAAQPGVAAAEAAPSGSYPVARGDTLSEIAARYAEPSHAHRWMVAAFQGNPDAFGQNMNVMRAGAVLRVPDQAAVRSMDVAAATAEVRRQYAAWRSTAAVAAAGTGDESGRLRLVTPSESSAGAGAESSSQQVEALRGEVKQLQSQLDEARRLLEIRNAELAELQGRLSAQQQPAAEPPPPAQTAAALPEPEEESIPASDEAAVAEESAVAAPVASAPPPPRRPAPATEAPAEEGSLLDTLKGQWWLFAALLAAVGGLFGFKAWRSRQQAEFDASLDRLATAGVDVPAREAEFSMPPPAVRSSADSSSVDDFLVEETGTHARFVEGSGTGPAVRSVSADDTISGEAAINLDQGDPLAEADFHMAYGLYDQAADLVRIAIEREPERRDLRLKLLEVYFVWGNREQFLQAAGDLADSREHAAPGEWEKIVIMGKQIAPDDPLFADAGHLSGAAAAGVDLDIEGGQDRVDFDLMGDSVPQDTGIDLDIGTALGEREVLSDSATDRNLALDDDAAAGLANATTRQMTATLPGGAASATDFGIEYAPEAPTVEQPGLYAQGEPALQQKVEAALRQGATAERTEELALDDLGLDLNTLDTMDQPPLDATPDAPTLIAGMDEHSRRLIETAELQAAQSDGGSDEGVEASSATTGSWRFDDDTVSEQAAFPADAGRRPNGHADASASSEFAALKDGDTEIDFDVGTMNEPVAPNGEGIDLDVGTATVPDVPFTATQRIASEDLALPELEPVTMSEVGTKLDLARAYMDMGDPEGARNILEEVMQEGSVAQKQEAQRLIESLPG